MSDPKIPGGYILKARRIQESEIAHSSPCIREVWDWLLMQANHSPQKSNGRLINRGQCVRSLQDIKEGLAWYVGYRKESYSRTQCEYAMNWLRTRGMITTTKTTRGLLINIDQYSFYQDPKNYEHNSEPNNEPNINPTTTQQQPGHYKQECKNEKNEKNNYVDPNGSDTTSSKKKKQNNNYTAEIDEVIEFYSKHASGTEHLVDHGNAVLSNGRLNIRERLKDGFSVRDCKDAILGVIEAIESSKSWWSSQRDLEGIFKTKSGKYVEQFSKWHNGDLLNSGLLKEDGNKKESSSGW